MLLVPSSTYTSILWGSKRNNIHSNEGIETFGQMPESLAMIHSSEFAPTTRRRSISPSEFEGERLSRGNAMHSDSEPVSVRPPPSGPKPSQSHRCRTKPNGRRAGGAVSSGCLGRRATGVAKCGRVLAPRWTSQSHLCIKVTEKSLSGSRVLRVNSMTKK